MKDTIVSNYRSECGDELLDVFVEFQAGAQLTQEEQDIISADYASCATSGIQKTMNTVVDKIGSFIEQKEEILSNIGAK